MTSGTTYTEHTTPPWVGAGTDSSVGARASATGAALAFSISLLFGTGSHYNLANIGEWKQHVQRRAGLDVDDTGLSALAQAQHDQRTPAEHLANIRETFKPFVSELARAFGVTRQAVYKWLSGEANPEYDKYERIKVLSQAADALRQVNSTAAPALLKTRMFDGRSYLELVSAGEQSLEHLLRLVNEAKMMQEAYERSGIASSKASPTTDWQSSESIPGTLE